MTKSFWYACRAAAVNGKARCRYQEGRCASHNANSPKAPRPDVVIVKFGCDDIWVDSFLEEGVYDETRKESRQSELEVAHVRQAEAIGRNAYAARPADAVQTKSSPDSGSPVFGKNGLAGFRIGVEELITKELPGEGFVLTRASVLKIPGKPGGKLTLEFSKLGKKPEVANFPWDTLWAFARGTAFNQIYVWANESVSHDPLYPQGKVVHTAQLFSPLPASKKPENNLRFSTGDWTVEPVAVTEPVAQ